MQSDSPTLFPLHGTLSVSLTLDDYRALGARLFTTLQELQPAETILPQQSSGPQSEWNDLTQYLRRTGLTFRQSTANAPSHNLTSAALDSILYPLYLTHTLLHTGESVFSIPLRDPDGDLLQGWNALLTCTGTCKPVYYFCLALPHIQGDIIYLSNQCAVIRQQDRACTSFCVIAYNVSTPGLIACQKNLDARQVRGLLSDFQDEIGVHVGLRLPAGTYAIRKYILSRSDNIFAYLSNLDFRSHIPLAGIERAGLLSGAPALEIYLNDVRTVLDLTCTIHGAGMQVIFIQPL